MFDILFMRQKRATDRLSARIKVQTAVWHKLTRADAFTRWWDGHASTKQRCEIQCEALAFMI